MVDDVAPSGEGDGPLSRPPPFPHSHPQPHLQPHSCTWTCAHIHDHACTHTHLLMRLHPSPHAPHSPPPRWWWLFLAELQGLMLMPLAASLQLAMRRAVCCGAACSGDGSDGFRSRRAGQAMRVAERFSSEKTVHAFLVVIY